MQPRREAGASHAALSAELFQREAADFGRVSQAGPADRDDPFGYDLGHEVVAIEQSERLQELLESKVQNFDIVGVEIAVPQKSIDRHPVHRYTGSLQPPAILRGVCDRNLNVN